MSNTVTTTVRTELQALRKNRAFAAKSIERCNVKTRRDTDAFAELQRHIEDLESYLKN